MLKLHHTHHLGLPHLTHSTRRLVLSPAVSEADELIEGIDAEHSEDMIQLENTPDVRQLDEFWSGVREDLKSDPTWFDFTNE
ncbi:MAG TPA: hypothetical protein PKV96_00640 [Candidatus Saccharimonas sp.]|nr:hypothetical protein [Candidatus Saccharimonas sp.]